MKTATIFSAPATSPNPCFVEQISDKSSTIVKQVEQAIIEHEVELGRARLLEIVSEVPEETLKEHVYFYRQIIRTNTWPNEVLVTSLDEFYSDFLHASIGYVDAAFQIANSMPFNAATERLSTLFHRAVAAEALRGQFGKRSVTGLDSLLESHVNQLESVLSNSMLDDQITWFIQTLGSPIPPRLCAEAMLLEDFTNLRMIFSEAPNINEILDLTGDAEEVTWRFLRRYCSWHVGKLRQFYANFPSPDFEASVSDTRENRCMLAKNQQIILHTLQRSCSHDVYSEIVQLVESIQNLNHLNLALEPQFSFKGGPGLFCGLIFNAFPRSASDLSQQQISFLKWQLFEETRTKYYEREKYFRTIGKDGMSWESEGQSDHSLSSRRLG